tara:strand:+ start:81 stop:2090 length:2010 start_codon:yes stop_codon:yes gene_type:complete
MALAKIKTWNAAETLTAADLNAEFSNICNHFGSLDNDDIDSTASFVMGELIVGSGITSADGGQLHVHTGSAGTIQAVADADEAIFENSGAAGITILSGTSSTGMIAFGDSGDADIGKIVYNHSTNGYTITANAATALQISSAGAVTTGGSVLSDTDSTDSLGSASVRWANLYVDSIGDTGQALAITAGTNAINLTAGDVTLYDDNNNADTSISMGTSATEALVVEALNGGSNKTLEELRLTTKTASGTADHGKMTVYVDEAHIADVDDSGINLASGKTFRINGTNVVASAGDFSGPGSATDNAIVRFDGTGGKTGQNSGVTIDDSNNATGFANLTLSGELDAATGDFSGDVDIDGTLETDALTIGGTALLANDADGRLTTATGSGTLSGEANLRYDGSKLEFGAAATVSSSADGFVLNDGSNAGMTIHSTGTSSGQAKLALNNANGADAGAALIYGNSNNKFFINSNGAVERFSIDANGFTTITNSTSSTPYGLYLYGSGGNPNNTTVFFLKCESSTETKAFIFSNGSFQSRANSYGGISDVKTKQDITDARNYWNDFAQIKFRKFKFKNDVTEYGDNAPSMLGVIAQEIETIFPNLVSESPDTKRQEVPILDSEGNDTGETEEKDVDLGTTTKSVKYSILNQIGLKVIQELQVRLEAAETKIAALEAA